MTEGPSRETSEGAPRNESSARRKNRLAEEASPYLRQHSENPVDWYPWGEEALARAKREDKPILLSIGYSACHWCHVMERESFEDAAIAAKMNAGFVCVKVDREERPDLDQIYQLVVQLIGRSGGWPLTVFLTPELRPFFGGTYFPPADKYGMPGFPKLLDAIAEAWKEKRDELVDQAKDLTQAIDRITRPKARELPAGIELGPDLLERAAKRLGTRFDDEHGGFGQKPKFPNTMPLEVLLRYGLTSSDTKPEMRVAAALSGMREGGIFDHLGGGFHRYSTDEAWRVPHFEKMLYDNALLLRLYTDAARALENEGHRDTASRIVDWLFAEMQSPEGAFYATQDADSEGEEGKFFVFSKADVREALGTDSEGAELLIEHFGITDEGNLEHTGKTVLSIQKSVARMSIEKSVAPSVLSEKLTTAKAALVAFRARRPRPFRDEKILGSWNALTISALAEAGAAFDESAWITAARRAFDAVRKKLCRETEAPVALERLYLRQAAESGSRDAQDVVRGPGFLDDYAYLANAALDLYEVTGDAELALFARKLADAIKARFSDAEQGLVFTEKGADDLLVRAKDPYDNAVPSGTAMACRAFLRLGTLAHADYTVLGESELVRHVTSALENPFGFGQTLCELDRLVTGSVDVVLVGAKTDARTQALAKAAFQVYLPNRTMAWLDPNDPTSREACAAIAEGKVAKDVPVAYVCRGRTCSLPVETPEALAALIVRPG